jgi:hypothetical protein
MNEKDIDLKYIKQHNKKVLSYICLLFILLNKVLIILRIQNRFYTKTLQYVHNLIHVYSILMGCPVVWGCLLDGKVSSNTPCSIFALISLGSTSSGTLKLLKKLRLLKSERMKTK